MGGEGEKKKEGEEERFLASLFFEHWYSAMPEAIFSGDFFGYANGLILSF